MRIDDLLEAVLARDEVVDHARLQRARAEQRHQRDDVVEAVRLQLADQLLHAADSSWNTAVVSALLSSLKASASSTGIAEISIGGSSSARALRR